MPAVREWYERLCESVHLAPAAQVELFWELLWEVVRESVSRYGVRPEVAPAAQVQLVTARARVPPHIADAFAAAVRWAHAASSGTEPLRADLLLRARSTLAAWIASLTGEALPECLQGELFPTSSCPVRGKVLRLTVRQLEAAPRRAPRIAGWTNAGEPITVLLFPPWEVVLQQLWPGATVHILGARALRREGYWAAGEKALIIVEPDRLVDVTEIAPACREHEWAWMVRLLMRKAFSPEAFVGWLLNLCFDQLLLRQEVTPQGCLHRAALERPIGMLAFEALAGGSMEALEELCRTYLPLLQRVGELIRRSPFLVEPAFVAPRYGLQGRLDVLVLDTDSTPESIVELKAGAVPQRAVWEEHRMQVVCYDLLLRAAFGRRARRCWLFYCRDQDFPLRELRPQEEELQAALMLRNRRAQAEWQLMTGSVSLAEILAASASSIPGGHELVAAYESCGREERAYVEELLQFLLREQWAQWRQVIGNVAVAEEHAVNTRGLRELELDTEASDWERLHLCFRRTAQTASLTALRPGDPVLLVPEGAWADCGAAPVLKGVLRSLGEWELWVSLRNKYVEAQWCKQWGRWTLQPESSDRLFEAQWAAVWEFLQAPPERRQRLLGQLPPRQRPWDGEGLPAELAPDQREVLWKALRAADYALVQGPPGTGKTSVILRTLVELLVRQPEEQLLVVAPTNRAVDELCRVLRAAALPFIRLGPKEATAYPEAGLSYAAERMPWPAVRSYFAACRIVVGTVASVLLTAELRLLKCFTTLIVDEASQVLEAQLVGLLCWAERAILIGDERQLPAVVVQPPEQARVRHRELQLLGFVSFAESLFERLLRQCIRNGWEHAYGMLQRQARMHELLQHFPSHAFYGGTLQTAGAAHQRWARPAFPQGPTTPLEELLSGERLLFVDCPVELDSYQCNRGEAWLVAQLVLALARLWGRERISDAVGVLVFYRRQASAIRQQFPEALRRLVTVDTVERFQGSERESIVISLALNHPWELALVQSLSRLPDGAVVDRRLNVMLTRARQQLVLVGSSAVLQHSPLYRQLLAFVVDRGRLLSAEELRRLLPAESRVVL